MKKLGIILFVLLGLLITTNIPKNNVQADGATTLVVHYHRFDPNYSPWNLWLWPYAPVPGDGGAHNFNGEDAFGKVYTLDMIGTPFEGSTQIGVIVRTNTWEKDVAIDRFIDLTNPNESGEVHVYLVSGDPTIYYSPDGIDISSRASNVNFTSINTISFESSKDVAAEQVTVLQDGTPVSFTNFVIVNGKANLELSGQVDLGKKYEVTIDFQDPGYDPKTYSVGFSGLYASDDFNAIYAYDGELGAIYSETSTTFKLWAPISENVELNIYEYGHKAAQQDYTGQSGTDTPEQTLQMVYIDKGVWELTVNGDLHGKYYTFNVTNGGTTHEVSDPYAFSAGINGLRSMVVDFDRLNPSNWDNTDPIDNIDSYNDAIIYELHVRDFTTHSTWNGTEEYRGKFLGLTERGTTYNGVTTGLDHLIELGVTHVQFLPLFDFGAAVDETRLLDPTYQGRKDTIFNWGYMPENFNAVEGSFSTDPYDGSVRVNEFKQLIQTFHENEMNVIMDVVYNHHGRSADSNFDLIVPGYYFRMNANGSFSNGSGTGNETASENYMMRKFIVDSVAFWAEEYKISGFRFDLMKLHDVETMNQIVEAVHAIDENILIYGEPWTGGTSPLPENQSAYNSTLPQMPGVAVFNDDTRDGIKGSVFDAAGAGFIQGDSNSDERIKLGILGATSHSGLTYPALPKGAWAPNPNQTINYATAHDNNVLFDKIKLSTEGLTMTDIQYMHKQAGSILLTSNGVPFLHAGIEILRSKPCTVIDGENQGECTGGYDHNSYRSPDQTNQIDWNWKVENYDVFEYYKGLIELRKSVGVFSMDTEVELQSKIFFFPDDKGVVSYLIYDAESPFEYTYVIHNNSKTQRNMSLQGYEWNLIVNREQAGTETIEVLSGDTVTVLPSETLVMYVANPDVEWNTVCNNGFFVEGMCIQETVVCDEGFTLNEETNECEEDVVTCEEGYTLNEETNECEENQVNTKTPENDTGCFGSITSTSLLIGAIAVLGGAVLIVKRRFI